LEAVSPASETFRRRHSSWDLLRCGFVLLVVLYHTTYVAPIVHPELVPHRFAFSHQIGASLLLVISAYFTCATLRRNSVVRYWWGRMARLLPAFVASVFFTWVFIRYAAPVEWPAPTKRDLVGNLLLLGNWKPAAFPYLDGSYWTLPLQLMGFTVAAVLWRSDWGHGTRLRVVLWSAVLLPLAQWPLRIAAPPETYRMLVDGLGFHRLHLFVAGVSIWMWANSRLRSGHFAALISCCMAAHLVHTIGHWARTVGTKIGPP
jgi:peptidoglycan/LPS O-acetylase OafA/YrhL